MTSNQPNGCNAEFTINDQRGNQKVNIGDTVTLRAVDTGATTYKWAVVANPPESKHDLKDSTQPQATLSALEEPGAYVIQLEVAEDQCVARAHHIVWAATPQRGYRLPAANEPLEYDGDAEWAGDLVQVIQDIDNSLPSPEQAAALHNEDFPASGDNPYVTRSQWSPTAPTAEEKAGLHNEDFPASADNPYVTRSQWSPTAPAADEKAGLHNEDFPATADNPYVTRSQWSPTAPAADEKAGLHNEDFPASADNPYVTRSQWSPTGPAELWKAGLHNEDFPASADNPYVTRSQWSPTAPAAEEKAGLHNEDFPANQENPYVTKNWWETTAPTEEQKAALDALEDLLGPGNRIATLDDIAQARTVATGNVDLRLASLSVTPGRVGVIATDLAQGLATLSFPGYDPSRQQNYVVNVLPINKGSGSGGGAPISVLVVEFVDFVENGFQIRMSRISTEGSSTAVKRELGRCMVEVSEMAG